MLPAVITTIAIAIVGWFAYGNYRLYKVIQKKKAEYKEQISDLYQAIVIATLLSGPTSTGGIEKATQEFKSLYKGKTRIL